MSRMVLLTRGTFGQGHDSSGDDSQNAQPCTVKKSANRFSTSRPLFCPVAKLEAGLSAQRISPHPHLSRHNNQPRASTASVARVTTGMNGQTERSPARTGPANQASTRAKA
jgi:hypothetical protein